MPRTKPGRPPGRGQGLPGWTCATGAGEGKRVGHLLEEDGNHPLGPVNMVPSWASHPRPRAQCPAPQLNQAASTLGGTDLWAEQISIEQAGATMGGLPLTLSKGENCHLKPQKSGCLALPPRTVDGSCQWENLSSLVRGDSWKAMGRIPLGRAAAGGVAGPGF